MIKTVSNSSINSGWLDRVAIVMALICGIHCLITPVLIVVLPILAATFWTSTNFHLWMLAFVLPTAALATFSGCRKHKDRLVAALAITGMCLLSIATIWERASGHEHAGSHVHLSGESHVAVVSHDDCCAIESGDEESAVLLAGISLTFPTLLNLLGGLVLSGGHWRNFRLCRSVDCRCCK